MAHLIDTGGWGREGERKDRRMIRMSDEMGGRDEGKGKGGHTGWGMNEAGENGM